MSTLSRPSLDRLRPARTTVLWTALLLNTELLLGALYLTRPGVSLAPLHYHVYFLVWITLGLWAILATYPASGADERVTGRRRFLAGAIAVAYFGVLAYTGGLIGPSAVATGFRIAPLPPGAGPAMLYGTDTIQLVFEPFKVVGYLALAYLVYATVLDAARSAIGGVLGVLSCVSCTWPVLATLTSGVLGGSASIATAASEQPYAISTVVFVATVALLYWRPVGSSIEF